MTFGRQQVSAATSSTLNFQGRLLDIDGGLVSDGSYNIQFKIYDSASSGQSAAGVCSLDSSSDDCWWIENRTVTVRNGYFSVYLADVANGGTAFTAGIPWDQELWLTMNVNSDGEMSPRFKLTAVPYAFRAGALVDATGAEKTADDIAQLAPVSVQAVNAANAALRLNQTGTGNLLQLQGDGSDVFVVDKSGNTTIGGGLTLGSSTSTTAGTIRWTGTDFEGFNGSSWDSLTSGGGGGGGSDGQGGQGGQGSVYMSYSAQTTQNYASCSGGNGGCVSPKTGVCNVSHIGIYASCHTGSCCMGDASTRVCTYHCHAYVTGGAGGATGEALNQAGVNGGSGIVIIKVADTITASFSGGVTSVTDTSQSGYNVYIVKATSTGSETVTFSSS